MGDNKELKIEMRCTLDHNGDQVKSNAMVHFVKEGLPWHLSFMIAGIMKADVEFMAIIFTAVEQFKRGDVEKVQMYDLNK
jgi:hypothetical protein